MGCPESSTDELSTCQLEQQETTSEPSCVDNPEYANSRGQSCSDLYEAWAPKDKTCSSDAHHENCCATCRALESEDYCESVDCAEQTGIVCLAGWVDPVDGACCSTCACDEIECTQEVCSDGSSPPIPEGECCGSLDLCPQTTESPSECVDNPAFLRNDKADRDCQYFRENWASKGKTCSTEDMITNCCDTCAYLEALQTMTTEAASTSDAPECVDNLEWANNNGRTCQGYYDNWSQNGKTCSTDALLENCCATCEQLENLHAATEAPGMYDEPNADLMEDIHGFLGRSANENRFNKIGDRATSILNEGLNLDPEVVEVMEDIVQWVNNGYNSNRWNKISNSFYTVYGI